MREDERVASLEIRLAALERTVEGLVEALQGRRPTIELPASDIPNSDDTLQDNEDPDPFADPSMWIHNVEKDTYECRIGAKRCPEHAGDLHKIFRNGYTTVMYKDIGRVLSIRVRRYICKNCRKSFLQPLPHTMNNHRITARLYWRIKTEIAPIQTKGGKLPRGYLKKLSEKFCLDPKVVSAICVYSHE